MDVAVDGARGRDEAVTHDRLGVRADPQFDTVADPLIAGAADADDPAVLDADVGLDDAQDGVDDERARDHDVELGVRRPPLHRARAHGLGVAPDRLVTRSLAILVDADPQVGVAEAHTVAGRRSVAGETLGGGEPVPRHRN